jgi:hypothetical protein
MISGHHKSLAFKTKDLSHPKKIGSARLYPGGLLEEANSNTPFAASAV